MRTLLDTNAYSALVRGHRSVSAYVRDSRRIFLPATVVGELQAGFRQGSKYSENLARLEAFLDRPSVSFLPATRTTADRYALVATALRRKGRPIPTNDIWIAAHALEAGADLLSSDSHFDLIDGLSFLPFDPDQETSVRETVLEYHAGHVAGD